MSFLSYKDYKQISQVYMQIIWARISAVHGS